MLAVVKSCSLPPCRQADQHLSDNRMAWPWVCHAGEFVWPGAWLRRAGGLTERYCGLSV